MTRLLQCDWKPPFTHLKWDRDNDGRYDPDNRPEHDPADWKPSFAITPEEIGAEPATLAAAPPSVPSIPSRLRETEIFEQFPELNTPAEKMPQENTEARAEHRNWKPLFAEIYTGSVVGGQSSGQLIGKTIIEGFEHLPEPQKESTNEVDTDVGQADYLTVLRLLQAIDAFSLAQVEFMTVLDTDAPAHGVQFNVFPKEMDERKKSWLYVGPHKDKRRMALLAELTHEGKRRYVIEIQQHRASESSTIVAWEYEGLRLPSGVLARLIMDCAQAESATLGSAHLLLVHWARLHHTTKETDEQSARHFLERIFAAPPRGEAEPRRRQTKKASAEG